jgi:hypothetical protein
MNIGSTDPIDFNYLHKLKRLAARTRARWVSDHLCWTGIAGLNTHDLLPMPYTRAALMHTVERAKVVMDVLERPIFLENPSTYLEFTHSDMREANFLAELAERSGCGLLLDVNNVYVSAFNHRFDPYHYIDALPTDRTAQIHLAGHTNHGTHILDTHSDHVIEAVWKLYRYAIERMGNVSTLLEWDENVPPFEVVHQEALKARQFRDVTPEAQHEYSLVC